MTTAMFTISEKVAVIEELIQHGQRTESQPPETIAVLKSIAKDLRARMDGAPGVAEHELGRRVTAIKVAKARGQEPNGALTALGLETVARWSVLQQALAIFNQMSESGR